MLVKDSLLGDTRGVLLGHPTLPQAWKPPRTEGEQELLTRPRLNEE